MFVKKIFLVVLLCLAAATVNAGLILDQNFENSSIFVVGQPIVSAGIGDGTTSNGLWKNPLGTFSSPQVVADNSSFSTGTQCIEMTRGTTYGSGVFLGSRTNVAATGEFIAEFAFKVPSTASQFALGLVDSQGNGTNQVAIAYSSGKLRVRDAGVWKDKTGGVSANSWFKVTFAGNIPTGTYETIVNFGSWSGNLGSATFNNTVLSSIAGLRVDPWLAGYSFKIDDIQITAVPEPATVAMLSLGAIAGIFRKKRIN